MGLSERFELIHAKEKRAAGTAQHGSRGGRSDKRTRAKLARKTTLARQMDPVTLLVLVLLPCMCRAHLFVLHEPGKIMDSL